LYCFEIETIFILGEKKELNKPVSKDPDDEAVSKEDEESHPLHNEDSSTSMIPHKPKTYSDDQMKKRSKEFYLEMNNRRSVRFFSDKDVPIEVIENCIKTAGMNI